MGLSVRFLWTSGPDQRNSAIKFFALAFTLVTLAGFICQTFGVGSVALPPMTETLLGIFWGGYILNKRSKDWINSKQDTAPGSGAEA
jgi:hypothetical protein